MTMTSGISSKAVKCHINDIDDVWDIYMIATAAENEESAFEKAYNGLQGWIDCFEKASLKGMVSGGGFDVANTAEEHVDIMKKAYELGKNL